MAINKSSMPNNPWNTNSRRDFLKRGVGIGTALSIGVWLWEISADSISQKIRSVLNVEYSSPLGKSIEQLKRLFPEINQWINSEEWANDIISAFHDNQLELTDENLGIALTLINSSSWFRSDPRAVDFLPSPSEMTFHELGIKSPKTSGPLETSVQFIMNKKGVNYEKATGMLTERAEWLKLGIDFLKKIIQEYSDVKDSEKRLKCIFADYNAWIGASRRAGIQTAIRKLSGKDLLPDGIFGKTTFEALEELFKIRNIAISRENIESDLRSSSEKMKQKPTYRELCKMLNVENLGPEVATTRVQGIIGFLKEHLTGVRTSKDYAIKRFAEYNQILDILIRNPISNSL